MAASDHQAIREYLMRESQGLGNSGRKMVLNPQTGKFEVASQFDSRQDVADITAEDLRSFSELLRDVKAPNKIVLSRTVLECIVREKVPSAQLTYADDGDVVTVTNEPGGELQLLHIDDRNQVASCLAEARRSAGAATVIGIVVDGELQCFVRDSQRDQPIPMTLLPGKVDVFDRVRGVFETDVLAGRSVAVLGLGSGGSFILRELAKCGVGQFLLLDDDRLEIGNVCRHECGLSDVGRLKVNAMREYVLDRHPSASITALPLHIDSDTIGDVSEALRAFSPDIVVCATDNRPSRLIVNRICVREGMPAIYAGVFRRAYGGQVLRVIPQLSPCYQCFISALPSMAADREISSEAAASQIAYSDREVAVEPGLSSDIAPVALLVVKLTLIELIAGHPTTLGSLDEDLVAPLYLWLNRREPETEYAVWEPMGTRVDDLSILRWYGTELARNEQCPVCGTVSIEGVSPSAELDTSAFEPKSPVG